MSHPLTSVCAMPHSPSRPITAEAYLGHLDRESRRFGEVLAAVDPAAKVPTCPEWSAADLLWHLTEVQWFWGSIAGGRVSDDAAIEAIEEGKPPRPDDYGELLTLFGTARERLAAAVADGPDDTPLWSWASEQTLRFTRRRQSHEALIHRVDAELTAGLPVTAMDAALAADGVDEVVTVMWADLPDWATFIPAKGVLALTASDAETSWLMQIGRMRGTSTRSGKTYDEPTVAVVEPGSLTADADASATAADLDRWLWNRATEADRERITHSGDPAVLDYLAVLIAEGVQ